MSDIAAIILDAQLRALERGRLDTPDELKSAAHIAQAQIDQAKAETAATQMREAAQVEKDILNAAGDEYILEHVTETDRHRAGRHSADRSMMVRLGLYQKLEDAIDAAISRHPDRRCK